MRRYRYDRPYRAGKARLDLIVVILIWLAVVVSGIVVYRFINNSINERVRAYHESINQ